MPIYRGLHQIPAAFGPSALTIGNFDGVHTGHRRILRRVVSVAKELHLTPSVLTFDPHPTIVVAPDRAPRLMTTPEQRAELMLSEGVEQVLILPFTHELAHLSPENFVEKILIARLQVKAVLVGENFRFGRAQHGDVALLRQLGDRHGFATEIVPAVRCRTLMVSSSTLRVLIAEGKVSQAARLLERPYSLEGEVVPGRGVGSKQTVPTLNLATAAQVIPAPGVYVTRTFDQNSPRRWRSVTNIGYRPTFGESDQLTIETFLLDPFESPTPTHIRLDFLYRLRAERRFDSPEALKSQILRDVTRTHTWFRRTNRDQ